jgi:integrase
MAIRLPSHLHRNRYGIFYFRLSVPPDLQHLFQQREIYKSLGTARRCEAVRLVEVLSRKLGAIFSILRREMAKNTFPNGLVQADLIVRFDLKELGLSVELDHQPHELEHAKQLIDHFVAAATAQGTKTASTEALPSASPTLGTLFDKYLDELAGSVRPETVLDYRGDFNQFKAIFCDVLATAVTHEVLNGAKDILVKLPANINKARSLRGKPISEILSMGLPPQAAYTARKKWTRLDAFFTWGEGHGYFPHNYAANKRPKAKGSSYEKFTNDDLERLFLSTEFISGEFDQAFQFWILLIGLFTGARLEEIAQLHLADIKQDGDIWFFSITEDVDEAAGAATAKHVKNSSSVRACPVHSALIAAGLPEYIDSLKQGGYDRLFPELTPSGYGKVGARASEDFTKYRRSCGVGQLAGKSKKCFHSFRHTMITALQKAGVQQEYREALAGHVSKSINVAVYSDKPPLQRLKDEIERLHYGPAFVPFKPNAQQEAARRRAQVRQAKMPTP